MPWRRVEVGVERRKSADEREREEGKEKDDGKEL